MRKLSFALFGLAIVLCGCGPSLKDKIAGSWKIDPPTLQSEMLNQLKSNPEIAAQIQKQTEATRFEFQKDGTMSIAGFMPGNQPISGTWKLEGNNITVTLPNVPADRTPGFTVNADGTKLHYIQKGSVAAEADLLKAQ